MEYYSVKCLLSILWHLAGSPRVTTDVSLNKSLIRNMERVLKCGNIQFVIYYLLHQLGVCFDVEGCGGELKPGRMWASEQHLQGKTPNLHTCPNSQSARKAIGLTAHVTETAEPRCPRALAGEAVVERREGLARNNEPGSSFVRLLMSVTFTVLFLLSIWRLDLQRNVLLWHWLYLAPRAMAPF